LLSKNLQLNASTKAVATKNKKNMHIERKKKVGKKQEKKCRNENVLRESTWHTGAQKKNYNLKGTLVPYKQMEDHLNSLNPNF